MPVYLNSEPGLFDFSVFDENGQEIGEIQLEKEEPTPQDMPQELEINGVIYYPQF